MHLLDYEQLGDRIGGQIEAEEGEENMSYEQSITGNFFTHKPNNLADFNRLIHCLLTL